MFASTSSLQMQGTFSQFSYLIFMHSFNSKISISKSKNSLDTSLLLSVFTTIHLGSFLFFLKITGFRIKYCVCYFFREVVFTSDHSIFQFLQKVKLLDRNAIKL